MSTKKHSFSAQRKALTISFLILLAINCTGQLSGVRTIPSANYLTVATAIDSLNTHGVAVPGITFNVVPGHTETFPALNSGIINIPNFPPAASSPVVITKGAGAGVNPKITASLNGAGTMDGIIILQGTDYITFKGIDVAENSSNINSTTRMEWAYALLKSGPTNGSQHVTIRDCNISLNVGNLNSVGIYANNHTPASITPIVVTNTLGANSSNVFFGNTITSVCRGIHVAGYNDPNSPYLFYDQLNDIGLVGQNKNRISSSLALSGTNAIGIYADCQNNLRIANDSIHVFSNFPAGTPPVGNSPTGIHTESGMNSTVEIYNNTIILQTLTSSYPGYAIRNYTMGTNGQVNIHNNILRDSNWPTYGISQTLNGIVNSASAVTCTISNNLFTNITCAVPTGGFLAIKNTGAITNSFAVSSNSITGNTVTGGALSGFIYNSAGALATITTNNFTNNTIAGNAIFNCIFISGTANNTSVLSNTISNLSCISTAALGNSAIIRLQSSMSTTVSQNNINLIASASGSINGINVLAGTNVDINRNTINGFSSSNANGVINGIAVNGVSTITISNNMIGNFTTSVANNSNAINGLLFNGGTTINAFYNTVNLNATSSGAVFGTTGIFTNSVSAISLINNLVVNTSVPNGAGYVVGHRRNGSSLTNLTLNTDYNSYFVNAGSGGNRFTYDDGATTFQTINNYTAATGLAPREANSIAANPAFVSATDLHLNSSTTGVQNMGTSIAIITDFDAQSRLGNCPEIGADEFVTAALNSAFTAPNNTVCAGSTINFTNNSTGALNYVWKENGTTFSTTTNASKTFTATGNYTISLTSYASAICFQTFNMVVNVTANPTVNVVSSSTAICSGTSATLTANGASTYSWSTGPTSAAIAVSPNSNTTYTVTGMSGNCTDTKTISVAVNTTPTVNVASSSPSICSGTSATLTASGATTYLWNTGPTSAAIVVSPNSNTTYTVIGTSGNCTNTKTISVQVTPTPTVNAVSSSTSICSGSTATLTASGATSYSWNTGPTSAVIVVSPNSNTTYTVIGMNGNCSDTKLISVSVTATPTVITVSSSMSVCSGNTATLTASGATSYSWNTGPTSASITIAPASTTIYTVIGTTGNCSTTKTISVSVNALPIINVVSSTSILCTGFTATLNASGANSYTWSTSANGSVITITPNTTTNYTVTGTDGNGCSNSTVITQSVSICSGIATFTQLESPVFKLYPNPNTGVFSIETNNDAYIIIYDALGKEMTNQKIQEGITPFTVQDYPAGVYFVKIIIGNKLSTSKFIKEN